MAVSAQTALRGVALPASTSARRVSSLAPSTRRHALHASRLVLNLGLSSSEGSPPAAPSSRPCSLAALRAQPLGESGAGKQLQGLHTRGPHSTCTDVSATSAASSPAVHQEHTEGGSEDGIWNSLLRLLLDTFVDPKDADSVSTAPDSANAHECSSDSMSKNGSCNSGNTVPGQGHGHVGSRSQRCASSRGSSLQYLFGALLFASGLYLSVHEPALAAETSQEGSLAGGAAAALGPGVPTDMASSTLALAFVPGMPGAEGPFWDNVLRFVVYFITVFTGGLFTLLKPIYELAKNPVTLLLLIVVLGGGFSFLYFSLSAMLGLNDPGYT